ncbi:MAG: hypothetical protein PHS60_11950 [Zavarzinia sp.]|nr:hypothetical protein [Zavarzinia sp.]
MNAMTPSNVASDHEALGRRLIAEVDRSARYRGRLSLMRFDFHGNQGLGLSGDGNATAEAIGVILRPSDTVAPLGGCRFCLLAPESSLDTCPLIARRIWHWAHDELPVPPGETRPLLSFGVSEFEGGADSALDLYARAGMALAYAVARGGNRVAAVRRGGIMTMEEIR